MTDDEKRSHPAYLAALSFASAHCSMRSSTDSYYAQTREAAAEAQRLYDEMQKEYEAAFKLSVAAGWRYTPSHRLIGRAEHMPTIDHDATAKPQ